VVGSVTVFAQALPPDDKVVSLLDKIRNNRHQIQLTVVAALGTHLAVINRSRAGGMAGGQQYRGIHASADASVEI